MLQNAARYEGMEIRQKSRADRESSGAIDYETGRRKREENIVYFPRHFRQNLFTRVIPEKYCLSKNIYEEGLFVKTLALQNMGWFLYRPTGKTFSKNKGEQSNTQRQMYCSQTSVGGKEEMQYMVERDQKNGRRAGEWKITDTGTPWVNLYSWLKIKRTGILYDRLG